MNEFDRKVRETTGRDLYSAAVQTVQVNVGLRCNLQCRHCHLSAGPDRREVMAWSTMESIFRLLAALPGCRVDITGGAPELNPHFIRFVAGLRAAGHPAQVRTNLSVFFEPGMEELPEFFHEQDVQLVASLPCYLDGNVRAQRGEGVYEKSIAAIRRLNRLGYGIDAERALNLVYNPGGPFLPPDQTALEEAYRRELRERHGIEFTRLLTIANMPLGRFLDDLKRQKKVTEYRNLLADSFNSGTIDGLMCRHQICIAWDGALADCDFNLALGLSLDGKLASHIDQLDPTTLANRRIVTGRHCFGCTAGCGSSCGGALVA